MKIGIGHNGLTVYFTAVEYADMKSDGFGTHLSIKMHDTSNGWVARLTRIDPTIPWSNKILANGSRQYPYRCMFWKTCLKDLKQVPVYCSGVLVETVRRDGTISVGIRREDVNKCEITPLLRGNRALTSPVKDSDEAPSSNGQISLDDFRTSVQTVNVFLAKYRGHVVLSLDNNRLKFLIEG